MTLRFVSVNVNGLRNRSKRENIFHWLTIKDFDVIFIQETHCKDDSEATLWGNEWGGVTIWSNGTSQSRSVAVLFKNTYRSFTVK